MTYNTTNRQKILSGIDLLPGCGRKWIKKLYTNDPTRWWSLERYLPKLEKERKIYSAWFSGEKVYSLSKNRLKDKKKIPHDQVCGEALMRTKCSVPIVQFYSESQLRGLKFGAVPEWGALFPNGKLLLFEYSTADNLKRKKLMERKIEQYETNLYKFDEYFRAESLVLFVLEANRFKVEKFAEINKGERLFYCDLNSFLDVGNCAQLSTPIYIWGHDGGSYALKDS